MAMETELQDGYKEGALLLVEICFAYVKKQEQNAFRNT